MTDKTYTEAELKAAVDAAIGPLSTKITELEAKHTEAEIETKIAEAVQPVADELAQAKTALDVAEAKVTAAEQALADVDAYLKAEKSAEEAAAEKASRKDARIADVKAVASYSEDRIAARADDWAEMADEEFASFIEDLKAAGAKPAEKADDKLPEDTKLAPGGEKASREGEGSALSGLLDVRRAGFDPRRMN